MNSSIEAQCLQCDKNIFLILVRFLSALEGQSPFYWLDIKFLLVLSFVTAQHSLSLSTILKPYKLEIAQSTVEVVGIKRILFVLGWHESLALDFMPMQLLRNIYAEPFCRFMWLYRSVGKAQCLPPADFYYS